MIENMMEKLELFVNIANLGSISQGAAAMHINQSTASIHLKNLEIQIGASLFDRLGRGIQLNSNGKAFLNFAETTLMEFDKMRDSLSNRVDKEQNLTVCAGYYFNYCYLPAVLPLFAKIHPSVKTEVQGKFSEDIIRSIEQDQYDFGVVVTTQPLRNSRLIEDFTHDIPLCFICSPESLLAGKNKIAPDDVHDEVFIFTGNETGYRTHLEREFAKHRYRFASSYVIDSLDAIGAAVASNLGVSILPEHVVKGALDEKRLVALPVKNLNMKRKMVGIHSAERALPAFASDFISTVVDVLNR